MKAFLKLWFKNLAEGIPLGLFISLMWVFHLGPTALLIWLTEFRWDAWIYFAFTFVWIITAGTFAETVYSKWK